MGFEPIPHARPSSAEIILRVDLALNSLLRELIPMDSSERSISHKLAEHLQVQFPGWSVDCENYRQEERTKTLPAYRGEIRADGPESVSVFPGIIIHKRGHLNNLLVVELKKSTHPASPEHDIAKLRAFTFRTTTTTLDSLLGLTPKHGVWDQRDGSKGEWSLMSITKQDLIKRLKALSKGQFGRVAP